MTYNDLLHLVGKHVQRRWGEWAHENPHLSGAINQYAVIQSIALAVSKDPSITATTGPAAMDLIVETAVARALRV